MMNKQIRKNRASKIIACYLAMMILLQITQPLQAYALTDGPTQPEFNAFTPIGTSDMVDLASGDLNYNIPIMDVGGYPINLAYNSGVTMDQEASWTGLGWNLNVGQINRNVRGLPDDFSGDVVATNNNLKDNVTVGATSYINVQLIGALDNLSLGGGVDVQYNSYTGLSATPSLGASFKISENVSVGMQLSSSTKEGTSVTPNMSISGKSKEADKNGNSFSGSLSPSITYNTRQGLQSFNLAATAKCYNSKISKTTLGISSSGSGSVSFLENTFTPSKRLAFQNTSWRMSFSAGADVYGFHGEISMAGYASMQKLLHKEEFQQSYGYENTEFAGIYGLTDFNRENEQGVVTKKTMSLPVTNYTYDMYAIQGQGIGGTFRPYRGQTGMVFDPRVQDMSSSNSIGVEVEAGGGVHMGANFRTTHSSTHTGLWFTTAVPFFIEKISGNLRDYERIYYKNVGETRADEEYSNKLDSLGKSKPITFWLDATKNAVNAYSQKEMDGSHSVLGSPQFFFKQRKRDHREQRNQAIQKVTKGEARNTRLSPLFMTSLEGAAFQEPNHHTAGYIITDDNGGRHIYGETVYNKEKKEVTFNVGHNLRVASNKGLVTYFGSDNTSGNNKGRDHYFNAVSTPAYAHTYLLTSELSGDYEDLTGNGPSDDDLGTYTKFKYERKGDYRWRVPYTNASYNEGLKTDGMDQKGSYLYGLKENKYLKTIETKTHVAFIDLLPRKDGYGVAGENGGLSLSSAMYKIKSIRLYSKPEVTVGNTIIDPGVGGTIKPIKTAHFEYDYSLCPNTENNNGVAEGTLNQKKGKLTLKKVYFTYRGSNMGKYTPYEFEYDADNALVNPSYNVKAYDIWGNYKPFDNSSWEITDPTSTPQEFPYVDQENRELQDRYASSWSLRTIKLPSGGKIDIQYEADDYKYVQDKKAMQMFKVDGVTRSDVATNYPYSSNNNMLYDGEEAKQVVIKLPPIDPLITDSQIIRMYTEGLIGKSIYFNFLLNMTDNHFDYISGYFVMDKAASISENGQFLFIPMKQINREGKVGGTADSNPISVAGYFFGQQNLNAQINDLEDPEGSTPGNIVTLGKSLVTNLGSMLEIFTGANGRLKGMGCAKRFMPAKSWIRLLEPSGFKTGGGCRVKSVVMHDEWDKMLNISPTSTDLQRYAKKYGQKYNYKSEDGLSSSGVATYEPNICKENPLVMPFYNKAEKMSALSFQELPFGASFFPSPTVTYSRVEVKNITASDNESSDRTRSGRVVTKHYTTYDFPTITDFTNLDKNKNFQTNENQVIGNMLKGLLGLKINVKTDLTMAQGFAIQTNDMNGKLKMQEVYNNAEDLISSVEYKYSTDPDDSRVLKNKLPTINEKGAVSDKLEIGATYDIVNDFRESYANTTSFGVAMNTDVIPLVFIPIIIAVGIPERAEHTSILRSVGTTKVIHRTGILKEKIATDLGSRVSTKNHAWDAKTGQVLLTETTNEFDDQYYTLNYPAYWYYDGMGQSSANMDFRGALDGAALQVNNEHYYKLEGTAANSDISRYLKLGDEILINSGTQRLWVYSYNSDNSRVALRSRGGNKISTIALLTDRSFRVIRSGNRNNQMTSMASIVLMQNPLKYTGTTPSIDHEALNYDGVEALDPKIINASAVAFSDFWKSQCENGLPQPDQTNINQYLFNIKGDWRPEKSYAYLTGRNATPSSSTRKAGFFKLFSPFYSFNTPIGKWEIDLTNWTYASEVTKFNPYGVEIENVDALGRFSSAQYGYRYKLPVAVASNSQYKEMGFDGFEDYKPLNWVSPITLRPHFGFNQYINQDKYITDKASHTGKRSIALKPAQTITLTRKINGCSGTPPPPNPGGN